MPITISPAVYAAITTLAACRLAHALTVSSLLLSLPYAGAAATRAGQSHGWWVL